MSAEKIITVGLNPVWDRTCYVEGLDWGDHTVMASQTLVPAGKALNISRALAWLSVPSTAAGLWGAADYSDMTETLSELKDMIRPAFTTVEGKTRQNVTVVDTQNNREMHLRSAETLVTPDALSKLQRDILEYINPCDAVVFAGSIPQGAVQDECVSIISNARSECASLIVDTSGSALGKVVNSGNISVIKPNLEELSELLGEPIENDVEKVVSAARQLCDRVEVVIVSLGQQGAVAVTKGTAVYCSVKEHLCKAIHTVGCGDYLLAGYVSVDADLGQKLSTGVMAATAKAWGWVGNKSWPEVQQEIEIEIIPY